MVGLSTVEDDRDVSTPTIRLQVQGLISVERVDSFVTGTRTTVRCKGIVWRHVTLVYSCEESSGLPWLFQLCYVKLKGHEKKRKTLPLALLGCVLIIEWKDILHTQETLIPSPLIKKINLPGNVDRWYR